MAAGGPQVVDIPFCLAHLFEAVAPIEGIGPAAPQGAQADRQAECVDVGEDLPEHRAAQASALMLGQEVQVIQASARGRTTQKPTRTPSASMKWHRAGSKVARKRSRAR